MSLQESDLLLKDLIKLSGDVRHKINYLNNRRGVRSWEDLQSPAESLEEFVTKLEKLIASYPIPEDIIPTRQIRAIVRCTEKQSVMQMNLI